MTLHGNIVTFDRAGYGEITWQNGMIESVSLTDGIRDGENWILPGFTDLHLHGAGPFSVEGGAESVAGMAQFLASKGVVRFLPTYSCAPHQEIVAWINTVRPLVGKELPGARVAGLHIEGPWLDVRYGGGMVLHEIRRASRKEAQDFLDAAKGTLKLLAIAPEKENALEIVRFLVENQVVVAMGHTDCPPEFLTQAVDAGVSEVTHLFDSYPLPEDHGGVRQPGLTDMILLEDRLMKEIIMDGLHVPPELVKLTLRAAGIDHVIAITDGLQGAGLPEGRFLDGGSFYIIRDGEMARREKDGQIVGSSLTLNRAFFNMVTKFGFTPVEAARAAATNPVRQLHLDDRTGILAPGYAADITVLAPDLLTARAAYCDGRRIDDICR